MAGLGERAGLDIAGESPGAFPLAAAFDSSNGDIYVANSESGTVSVISGATNLVQATITVGNLPEALTFDSANGDIYVANRGGSPDNAQIVRISG